MNLLPVCYDAVAKIRSNIMQRQIQEGQVLVFDEQGLDRSPNGHVFAETMEKTKASSRRMSQLLNIDLRELRPMGYFSWAKSVLVILGKSQDSLPQNLRALYAFFTDEDLYDCIVGAFLEDYVLSKKNLFGSLREEFVRFLVSFNQSSQQRLQEQLDQFQEGLDGSSVELSGRNELVIGMIRTIEDAVNAYRPSAAFSRDFPCISALTEKVKEFVRLVSAFICDEIYVMDFDELPNNVDFGQLIMHVMDRLRENLSIFIQRTMRHFTQLILELDDAGAFLKKTIKLLKKGSDFSLELEDSERFLRIHDFLQPFIDLVTSDAFITDIMAKYGVTGGAVLTHAFFSRAADSSRVNSDSMILDYDSDAGFTPGRVNNLDDNLSDDESSSDELGPF